MFAICSDRGSPGCTTVALALAAARGLPAVVVEADPYGGDLALRLRPDGVERHPLPPTPTVLGVGAGRSVQQPPTGPLAMPTRAEGDQRHLDLWREGSHELTQMVRVVPGFLTAEQGSGLSWPVLSSALQSQSGPVFADLGRIHTGSPSMSLATAADALIPVCRGDMGSVVHMVERLEQLMPVIAERHGRPPVVLPVVVSDRRNGAQVATRIAEILSESAVAPTIRGVGWLAWDRTAVEQLERGGDPWGKPLKKSHLMRSARKVMWRLGLATGLDHAEPEDGRRTRGEQQRATQQQGTVQGLLPRRAPPTRDTTNAPTVEPVQGPRGGGALDPQQPPTNAFLGGGPASPEGGVWATSGSASRHESTRDAWHATSPGEGD